MIKVDREIFISKASYKKRRASRIVKDYLNKVEEAKKLENLFHIF